MQSPFLKGKQPTVSVLPDVDKQVSDSLIRKHANKNNFNTYCFFHLYLVNLDSKQSMLEITIKNEFVFIFYILALWIFNQYSCFTTGQRLQGSSQFTVLCKQVKKYKKNSLECWKITFLMYRSNLKKFSLSWNRLALIYFSSFPIIQHLQL